MTVLDTSHKTSESAEAALSRLRSGCEVTEEQKSMRTSHILTITLEDYFQVGAFRKLIPPEQWYRFEPRLVEVADQTLQFLADHGAQATFFVTPWNAKQYSRVVKHIQDCGHEIAQSGLFPHPPESISEREFRTELKTGRDAIEQVIGQRVQGFRLARGWIKPHQLWMLDCLAEQEYAYDSSLFPIGRQFSTQPQRRYLHEHRFGEQNLWEFPLSTTQKLGVSLPIAGGNYFRQLPHWLMKQEVRKWTQRTPHPFVMYFNIWELDCLQPRVSAGGWLTQVRHYRNLEKIANVLKDYLREYRFVSVSNYLTLPSQQIPPTNLLRITADSLDGNERSKPVHDSQKLKPAVTVVIPCYNEEQVIPYLAKTLVSVQDQLAASYSPRFLFVDDCSGDDTLTSLRNTFGAWPNCRILQHEVNRGVAAAIDTGLKAADTEIVCSMDCDCTYDPHELVNMIPLLEEGIDLVTASPYHPLGQVKNVPGWRLILSKGSSWMYRRIVGGGLHTYTSCFRVYRRSQVLKHPIEKSNFLGIAEMLSKMLLSGSRVVEHPATLEVRIFGQSKMKTLKTIGGHLRLLRQLGMRRLRGGHSAARTVSETSRISV